VTPDGMDFFLLPDLFKDCVHEGGAEKIATEREAYLGGTSIPRRPRIISETSRRKAIADDQAGRLMGKRKRFSVDRAHIRALAQ
jgi:hypothetical protein